MKTNGIVEISLRLNVYDLDTDAVCADEDGTITITDDEQFFSDWIDGWVRGTGELLGASTDHVQLNREPDDFEDDEEDDEEDAEDIDEDDDC